MEDLRAGIERRRERRDQMFFMNYDLEKMVPMNHPLRTIKDRFPAREIAEKREEWKKCLGREGYGMEVGLKALFLQFWGDFSDREMEERLKYDLSFKWFCGFRMEDKTPDHTFFCRARKNLGETRIEELFHKITEDQMLRKIRKRVGAFVDASAIRRKVAEWKKRDAEWEKEQEEIEEAIRQSTSEPEDKTEEKAPVNLGNQAAPGTYSGDKEARWGCKGGKKYWFGYKRHVSVDIASGLIEKVWVTPANVADAAAFKLVCPTETKVFADRGYDTENVRRILREKQCEDGVMRLKNRKDFDKERNKELSKKRAPWEHVFSKMSRRTRYMGVKKTYLQALMEAIVHNMKRVVLLEGLTPAVIGLS
jgi:transposase, IS5 family